jgi:hypothetical protein
MKIIDNLSITELWDVAMETVKEDLVWQEHSHILDYLLSEREGLLLTSYEFDIIAETTYGGSEGIYSRVYLDGVYTSGCKASRCRIGTLKTLGDQKEDYLRMSTLSSLIAYHMGRYVNSNINRFEASDKASIGFVLNGEYGNITILSILEEMPVFRLRGKETQIEVTPEIMRSICEKVLKQYKFCMTAAALLKLETLHEKYNSENT